MDASRHSETDCPMTRLMGVIASKWSMPILYNLLLTEEPMRFGALRKAVGRVSQRELSLTLKRFEELGVVKRKVYPEVPPRVEYWLTPLGRTLEEAIMALGKWAEQHAHLLQTRAGKAKAARAGK